MVMRVERKNHRHVFQMRAGVTERWDQVAGRLIGRQARKGRDGHGCMHVCTSDMQREPLTNRCMYASGVGGRGAGQ
jgi:hypothetical protein